jgi:FolB domain-containing protein
MDSVRVDDLRVRTRIGVPDEERATPQYVLVSFEVFRDLAAASTTDDLEQTIDYGALVPQVAQLVERAENRLLERLAGDVASLIKRFPGVSGVTVEIAKEAPPLDEEVGRVAVRIERQFG